MYRSTPLTILVSFVYAHPGGAYHAVAKASGAPWAKARTLCGLPLDDLRKAATWEVGAEKTPGLAANPFYGPRGCHPCQERLSV